MYSRFDRYRYDIRSRLFKDHGHQSTKNKSQPWQTHTCYRYLQISIRRYYILGCIFFNFTYFKCIRTKGNLKKLTCHENNLNKYRLVRIANTTINTMRIAENGFIIRIISLQSFGNFFCTRNPMDKGIIRPTANIAIRSYGMESFPRSKMCLPRVNTQNGIKPVCKEYTDHCKPFFYSLIYLFYAYVRARLITKSKYNAYRGHGYGKIQISVQ